MDQLANNQEQLSLSQILEFIQEAKQMILRNDTTAKSKLKSSTQGRLYAILDKAESDIAFGLDMHQNIYGIHQQQVKAAFIEISRVYLRYTTLHPPEPELNNLITAKMEILKNRQCLIAYQYKAWLSILTASEQLARAHKYARPWHRYNLRVNKILMGYFEQRPDDDHVHIRQRAQQYQAAQQGIQSALPYFTHGTTSVQVRSADSPFQFQYHDYSVILDLDKQHWHRFSITHQKAFYIQLLVQLEKAIVAHIPLEDEAHMKFKKITLSSDNHMAGNYILDIQVSIAGKPQQIKLHFNPDNKTINCSTDFFDLNATPPRVSDAQTSTSRVDSSVPPAGYGKNFSSAP